jgi:hypothetical protein
MTNPQPPTTNAATHFDSLTNEWVTTFTVRHKANSAQSATDSLSYLNLLGSLNNLHSDVTLPTLNQKDLGIRSY